MGGFPEDEAKAFGVISNGASAAALAGATKVIVKTPHEAIGVPTKEANAAGIRATKMVLNLLRGQKLSTSPELEKEIEIIKAETKCILDKVYELSFHIVHILKLYFNSLFSSHNPSRIPTAFDIEGGTNVPVNGPNGSLLIDTPCSSYHPTNLSTYCQSMRVFSSETDLA